MSRILLLSSLETSWKAYRHAFLSGHDLLIADPADTSEGHPARLVLWREDRPLAWRFIGSLWPQRTPHLYLAALQELLELAGPKVAVQLFPWRPMPVLIHLTHLAIRSIRPERILMPDQGDLPTAIWPMGPEPVLLEPALPGVVQLAQRKARWMKLLAECREHTVRLDAVRIEGGRLGSGQPIPREDLLAVGLKDVLYAELSGHTLFAACEAHPDEGAISRALDQLHAERVRFVTPETYLGLTVAFSHEDGQDFAMGVIQGVDFELGLLHVLADAEPPVSPRILKLGGLRLTPDGEELGEAKPYEA